MSDEDEEADEKDQFQIDDEKEELEQGLMIPGQTDGKQSELMLLRASKTYYFQSENQINEPNIALKRIHFPGAIRGKNTPKVIIQYCIPR